YIRPYIEAARRHDGAPRPSDLAREAMDRVDAMCADSQYHVGMMLEPGDMQFINNYHVLHGRKAYTDVRDDGKVRHLKRLRLVARYRGPAPRRKAGAVPSRPHRRQLVGEQRPHKERARRLTACVDRGPKMYPYRRPASGGRGAA